jgi:hypothetical protein
MKKLAIFMIERHLIYKCLPFALVAMALVVTGCPHNDYTIQLNPHGNVIERTLVFYCVDGANTNNGTPNYQAIDAEELAAITALYPANSLTNDGGHYIVRGEFTSKMPNDVGGTGVYTNLANSLGEAGFYVERFRGNDDLAGMSERRFKAAEQLADLIIGWSQTELSREPGYEKFHQFLDVGLRRDLKNLSSYWWEGALVDSYKTNASEEFAVRFGQYLFERGYFTLGEIPDLFKDTDNSQALLRRIQRLVARKMGVPDTEPVPPSLAFLADETKMEKSFTNYLAGTDAYHAKLKQWEEDKKLKPDAKQAEPSDVLGDVFENMVNFDLFGGQSDHLAVRLSLPMSPIHSNGRWDEANKQVVWITDMKSRTNATRLPFSCYASWVQADEEFQKEHLGKVALTGDELMQYCLWRSSQDTHSGAEWDDFLAGLKPGTRLMERLDSFRFSSEVDQVVTNKYQNTPIPSAYPRGLLKSGLQ